MSETNILFNPLLDAGFTLFPYSCNVRNVKSGSFSEYSGVMPGWRVTKIKGVPVSPHSVERALQSAQNASEMYNIVFLKKEPRYGADYFKAQECPSISASVSEVAKVAEAKDSDVNSSGRARAPPKDSDHPSSRTGNFLQDRRSSISSSVKRAPWPPPYGISEKPLLLPSQIIMDSASQVGEASEIWEIEASPSTSDVAERHSPAERKEPAPPLSWDPKKSAPQQVPEGKASSPIERSQISALTKSQTRRRRSASPDGIRCKVEESPEPKRRSKSYKSDRLQEVKVDTRNKKEQRLFSPERQGSVIPDRKKMPFSKRRISLARDEKRFNSEVSAEKSSFKRQKPLSESLRLSTHKDGEAKSSSIGRNSRKSLPSGRAQQRRASSQRLASPKRLRSTSPGRKILASSCRRRSLSPNEDRLNNKDTSAKGYEHLKPVPESTRLAAAKLWRDLQTEVSRQGDRHDRDATDNIYRREEPSYSRSRRSSRSISRSRRSSVSGRDSRANSYYEEESLRSRFANLRTNRDADSRNNYSSSRTSRTSTSLEPSERLSVRSNRSRHRQHQQDSQHKQIRDWRNSGDDRGRMRRNQEHHSYQSRQESQYEDKKAPRPHVRGHPERLSLECNFSRKSEGIVGRASEKSPRERYYSSSPQHRHSEKAGGR